MIVNKYRGNGGGSSYELPIAGVGDNGILGGVKVDGDSITIDENGVISAEVGASDVLEPVSDLPESGTAGEVRTVYKNEPKVLWGLESDFNGQFSRFRLDNASYVFLGYFDNYNGSCFYDAIGAVRHYFADMTIGEWMTVDNAQASYQVMYDGTKFYVKSYTHDLHWEYTTYAHTIDAEYRIGVYQYDGTEWKDQHPVATRDSLGMVKVGDNLNIADGVLTAELSGLTQKADITYVDSAVTQVETQMQVLANAVNYVEMNKQNKLTAGAGITITDDVISAQGGSGSGSGLVVINYNDITTAKGLEMYANPEQFAVLYSTGSSKEMLYFNRESSVEGQVVYQRMYGEFTTADSGFVTLLNNSFSIASDGTKSSMTRKQKGIYTLDEINTKMNQKQNTLTAGDGITISGNTISADKVLLPVDALPASGTIGEVRALSEVTDEKYLRVPRSVLNSGNYDYQVTWNGYKGTFQKTTEDGFFYFDFTTDTMHKEEEIGTDWTLIEGIYLKQDETYFYAKADESQWAFNWRHGDGEGRETIYLYDTSIKQYDGEGWKEMASTDYVDNKLGDIESLLSNI